MSDSPRPVLVTGGNRGIGFLMLSAGARNDAPIVLDPVTGDFFVRETVGGLP